MDSSAPVETVYEQRFYDQQQGGSLASARATMPAVFAMAGTTLMVDVG